jgi:uncharacterized membrane protein
VTRRVSLDWLRGIAVLCMITWHVLDAWSRVDGRDVFAWSVVRTIGGVAAPLFLFLAGLAVPLAGEARLRRGDSVGAASRALQKRGWQIFGLAHLFRLQSFLFNPGARWHAILKPDILNILGLGLALTALLWGYARRRPDARAWRWFLVPAAVVLVLTPLAPHWWWPTLLHPRLEAYIRPAGGWGVFSLFPAIAFVFAGAWIGAGMASPERRLDERRFHHRLALQGAAITLAGVAIARMLRWLPWLAPALGDIANVVWRTGSLLLMVWLAWAWTERMQPGPSDWIVTFGRTSLVVYWVHVELAYGILSYPVHHALPLGGALAGLAGMTVAMLVLARWWLRDRPRLVVPAHMTTQS